MSQIIQKQAPAMNVLYIPPKQGIYEESDSPCCPVGTKLIVGERTFRYCKNGGTALAAGKLVVNADVDANHIHVNVYSAAAIGATEVVVTLEGTAVTANQFAEGTLGIVLNTGQGYTYRIKSHAAQTSTTGNVTLTLYDPIQVALDTTTDVEMLANLFSGVVISNTDQADIPIGVPPIAVTASYYFWCQTGGLAAVLQDASVTHEALLTTGTSVQGAVEASNADTDPTVGYTIATTVDTEYSVIFLDTVANGL